MHSPALHPNQRSYFSESRHDEFPLPEQRPTAYEDKFPLLIQSDATVKKIALLLKTGVSHGQRHINTIQRSLPPVADEPASPIGDGSQGEACPTDSGLEADQDMANIPKTSTLPSDSTPSSGVGDQQGKRLDEGEEAAERVSDDIEEMATVLTSMDAARETNVPTGSGSIPTAGPPATIVSTGSEVGPTASLIIRRRKGKEILVESDTPKKKKLQEQIDA
nr:hypothetical protein [Tanacetum cinerariifolium]